MKLHIYLVHSKKTGKYHRNCLVYCPACRQSHTFDERWKFNGDQEKPTFEGSMLVKGERYLRDEKRTLKFVCHSFLRDGVWEFLGDCTHEMAGKKVPMIDFPENYRGIPQ